MGGFVLHVCCRCGTDEALDIVDTLVKSAAVDMVVVDSVAALVPKAELEGEMGDHHIALQVCLHIVWVGT